VETHHRRGTWQTKVSRFIALTEFARQKLISAGFSADQLMVKPKITIFLTKTLDDNQLNSIETHPIFSKTPIS